jgi:phospholipase/carboxylesterase
MTKQMLKAGAPLAEAEGVLVLIHGRGATAESILSLASELSAERLHWIAPQAEGNTWYPYPFIAPRQQNEPWLGASLARLEAIAMELEAAQVEASKVFWLGFSQGACLMLEHVATSGRRYGGAFGLSGGLIGQTLELTRYTKPLQRMPVYLGCGDRDAHIPTERVLETERVFTAQGAQVRCDLFKGMGHQICQTEIEVVKGVIGDRGSGVWGIGTGVGGQ